MVSYHLIATKRHWYPEKVQVRWACEAFCWLRPSLHFSRGKTLLKILNNQTVIERDQKKKKKSEAGMVSGVCLALHLHRMDEGAES